MAVLRTAIFQVNPESVDECLGAIREFIDHTRTNEPGTLEYVSWQDADDPTRFIHRMKFADEAAQQAHTGSEAVQKFTGILYPHLVGSVEFQTHVLVTGKE